MKKVEADPNGTAVVGIAHFLNCCCMSMYFPKGFSSASQDHYLRIKEPAGGRQLDILHKEY